MSFFTIFLFFIIIVTCSVSMYLIGVLRGRKGQKEIIKYIYKQEERSEKRKGFSQENKEEENKIKTKKRYTIN